MRWASTPGSPSSLTGLDCGGQRERFEPVAVNAKAIGAVAATLGKDAEVLASTAKKLETASDIAPARAGRAFTETTTGTLGPSVRDGDSEWAQVVNWATMATIQAWEYGIDSTNVITAGFPISDKQYPTPEALNAYLRQVTESIASVPGVRDASTAA